MINSTNIEYSLLKIDLISVIFLFYKTRCILIEKLLNEFISWNLYFNTLIKEIKIHL